MVNHFRKDQVKSKYVKMQVVHNIFIEGIPFPHAKSKGDLAAPKLWTETIIDKTKTLERVKEACKLQADFILPPNKYPTDLPHGPDLDNLLHRLFNALKQTVLGDDSLITHLECRKRKVVEGEKTGVHLIISIAQV